MKRKSLLLIGTLITILAQGQVLKFQGGTSISKLDWELTGVNIGPIYEESLTGYYITAGLDYLETDFIYISSNIGMVRKGGKGEFQLTDQFGNLTGQGIVEKPSLDFLTINSLINVKYPLNETISPFISIGPRFDYLVNSSDHFKDLDEMDGLNTYTIGLSFGGGVNYELSDLQFGLRGDYLMELTKVGEWSFESTGVSGEIGLSSIVISLTVGYRL